MAEKKSPASGWPIVKGDFNSGDANSPVAVMTCGSHLDEKGICDKGAAICGSCKTENLGLEQVIANIISNPNIRFLLLCGTEVKGHLAGQTMAALHKGGVKDGRVVGAEGAIPFIENLTDDAIKRFQEQVEVVNIMESEDLGAIKAKMNELKGRDPGAFAGDPIVVEVKEAAGGAEIGAAAANPQFLELEKKLDKIEKKIEFADAEIAQRVGRKIGRDIGILYGLITGITVLLLVMLLAGKLMTMV